MRQICWWGGGLARLVYIMVLHPAPKHIYSDMYGYVEWAQRFFTARPESIADTIHPPGSAIFYGILYKLDPTWALCGIVQWLMSLGIMAILSTLARRLYGPRVELVTLVMVTLYLPFTHYAALFLTENPFMFFIMLGLLLLDVAIHAPSARRALGWGLLAGLAVGLGSSFKHSVVGPFGITGLGYAAFALKNHRPHLMPLSVGAVLGLCVVFVPMSVRCTRLTEGQLCLAATNTAINVLMGHYGKKGMFYWHDRARSIEFAFQSPTTVLRGYTDPVHLNFGAYDTRANLNLAFEWVAAHPWEAVLLSFTNVWDFFATRTLWPSAELFGVDWGAVFTRIFWVFILLPSLVYLGSRAGRMARLAPECLSDLLISLPMLGMCSTVFLSLAEVRYRIPFDGTLIILAAQGYVLLSDRLRKISTQSS